ATLWGLWWLYPIRYPFGGAVLAAEALLMGVLAVLVGGRRPEAGIREHAFAEPLARAGEAVSLTAFGAAVWGGAATMTWAFENVVTGGCLFGLYLLVAFVEQNGFLARAAGLALTATAAVAAGWAGTFYEASDGIAWIALSTAAASTVMAAVAVGATVPTPARWYGVLARAWLETATAAGVIALALVARA